MKKKIDNKDQRLNCGIVLRPNIMTLPRPSFVWIFIGLLCFVLNLEKRKASARNFPFQRFNWIYLGILEQQLQRSSLIYITEIDHNSYVIVLLQLKRLCKVTTNVKHLTYPCPWSSWSQANIRTIFMGSVISQSNIRTIEISRSHLM